MIVEITMYTVKCDKCGKTSGEEGEYAGWNLKDFAEDEALESGWHKAENENHYCENCWNEITNDDSVHEWWAENNDE